MSGGVIGDVQLRGPMRKGRIKPPAKSVALCRCRMGVSAVEGERPLRVDCFETSESPIPRIRASPPDCAKLSVSCRTRVSDS